MHKVNNNDNNNSNNMGKLRRLKMLISLKWLNGIRTLCHTSESLVMYLCFMQKLIKVKLFSNHVCVYICIVDK